MGTKKKKSSEDEPMEVEECPNQNGGVPETGELDHISDDEEGGVRIGDIYIPPAPKPALTLDVTGPRLIITHIVNNNFKSYAGEQHLGPLHKCFTAIIGPNGSGKSNVIDSMLFVFGYRASKIRSKKISVLIHSSSKHPNINSASVAVHFCQIIDGENEEFTVVPNSEIVVTRTAFKDNSSTYTLNGRRVQFKEVARTLRAHGIDLDHNRFLILQGEVEQIAMMKPKGLTEHESGMLEYLEDIIGTSRYKEPIEKLNLKVEELSEMRKDKLNRVRLVEQEKQRLEQPMREAVELMNLTNVVLRTRNTLLQKYIYEANKMVAAKCKELDVLKENLAQIDEKLKQLNDELQENNTVLKNGTQKYDALKVQKDEVTEKLHTCKKRLVAAQSENTQANKKKKNLEQLLEQEKGKLIDLELVPEKNKREIKDCEKLLEKLKESQTQAQSELETAMAGVRSKTQGFKETKDKLETKMVELKKIVDEANNVYELAESELKIYLKREEEENEILRDMKQSYEKGENDFKEKTRLQKELEKSVPLNEKKLQEISKKLQALKDEETTITKKATALRTQVEQSKQMMSASKSRGRVLDSLMRQKNNGNLPGIFGRLGDLGGIDTKYDVAISTCCGALDNIVVDTVETAQACVEYLKTNNIGRGTMIALDQQEHLRKHYEGRRVHFPENVERLFDLIQVKDDRVKPAFYFALRDTLVANDLEQASRIAYGATRYRVVTLKGDLIETSGTMSGGGRTTMRGRMGSSVQQDTTEQDPVAMQQSEQKLAELDNRFQEIRTEQLSLDDKLQQMSQTVNNGKATTHQLNIELKSLRERIPVLKNQIKLQEKKVASCKVDPKQKVCLEKKLKAAEENYNSANINAEEVKDKIKKVNEQIAAVTGGQVKELQKNFDNIKKKITKVSSEINKLNVAISASERNAAKSKRAISQMESDLKETEKNLETISVQKKDLTLEVSQFQKQLEELEEKINEGTDEFADLRKKISKMQKKEIAMKNERLDANTEVQKMEKTVQEMKAKTPVWQKELKSLKLEDPGIEGVPGIERPAPLVTHTDEELEEVNVEELRHRLTAQKGRIGDGKPNIQAVQDYKEKEDLFLKRVADLDEITKKRNDMRQLYDQLKKKRTTDFLAGFNTITCKLKEMYQMITLGGDAELELVDSLDPFTEGIIFSVRPPNKSWKNISNLSGGEKTLSSLALVFALHYYKPSPLYVMDEIDAALDFKNVSIVANYIKERTKNAQFIIISLRYNMFEVSNRLVGIYKTEDCTQSVTVENKVVEESPGEELIAD